MTSRAPSGSRSADPGGRVDVIVVGAGLAGLVAARELTAAGADVVVVDDSDRAGGRLATLRSGSASLDAGAQFFTVRSDEFAQLVGAWTDEGCPITVWADGFARVDHVGDGPQAARAGGDGHPRYVVVGGMSALAHHLSRGLDLRPGTRVRAVTAGDAGWSVVTAAGERPLTATAVVCTPPVPDTLGLLTSAGVPLGPLADELGALRFDPCVALLATFDHPLRLPAPGGVQIAGGPVTWLADNAAKGLSATPALTVHAGPRYSAAHFDDRDADVTAGLLGWVAGWTAGARVLDAWVQRWRHARPTGSHPFRCAAVAGPAGPLVLAGDAFGEAKVEGAARSGLAAARLVRQHR